MVRWTGHSIAVPLGRGIILAERCVGHEVDELSVLVTAGRAHRLRSTQPFILKWWINQVPSSYAGWGKGGMLPLAGGR